GTQRVGGQVECLGGVLGEDDLLGTGGPDEARDGAAGALVGLGGLCPEEVHRPGYVRVVPGVVLRQRIDDGLRLLRRVPRVQVHQGMVPLGPGQDREIAPDGVDVEHVHLLFLVTCCLCPLGTDQTAAAAAALVYSS